MKLPGNHRTSSRFPKHRERAGAGAAVLFVVIIVVLLALYAFVISPETGERLTGQRLLPEAQPLSAPEEPAETSDVPLVETSANPPLAEISATPPPEISAVPPPDPGPGARPIRSATSGSMPIAESAIKRKLPTGADVLFKGWSDPVEADLNGLKHWRVNVTAAVILPGASREGRVDKAFSVYFRDGKIAEVQEGK